MEKFNPDAVCIKCTHSVINTTFKHWTDINPITNTIMFKDYLLRSCQCCGYSWKERPADHKENNNG